MRTASAALGLETAARLQAMSAPQTEGALEGELVRRARSGDLAAFEGLYHRHVGRIYAVSLRMVADAALAEELTQEAFVRAWRKLDSFRGGSAFATWLHRLAVNLVLDRLRSRRRRRQLDEQAVPPPRPAAADPAAELDLERAIARLPPRARTVFVLYDVEGYRHQEIAEMLGLSVGATKAHLHRARRRLREELAR